MAKPDSTQATETLHEIESVFDRLAQWTTDHPLLVLGVLVAILVGAASVGGYQAWHASREGKASAEVAAIEAEFHKAMGAKPGDIDIPEPANAEAAAKTRREYATRLLEAADRLSGTRAAVTARLEAGALQADLGDRDAALATWRAAADSAPRGSALEAVVRTRLAAGLESAGDGVGAGEAYLAAGRVKEFPGHVLALGDAARCFADAGQSERALEIFAGLSEADRAKLPVYVTAKLTELRMRSGEAAPAAAAPKAP